MDFNPKTKYNAFCRAGGRCECERKNCGHSSRCNKKCVIVGDELLAAIRNDYSGLKYPGFQFHHKTAVKSGGEGTLSNCEFLCEECHKNTGSYGRS